MIVRTIRYRDTFRVMSTISAFLILTSEYHFEVKCESQFNKANVLQNPGSLSGLIFTEGNQINVIDPNGENFIKLATSTEEPRSPTFSCKRKTLYWIEKSSRIQALEYSEYQSSSLRLFDDQSAELKSIAFDFITDKLYIGNDAFPSIEVVDLTTGYRAIILSDLLPAINSIAIDPYEGYLFVNGELELIRMDLDGFNIHHILNAADLGQDWLNINNILLDSIGKRVYWVHDVNGTISSSTYNGTDKKLHLEYRLSPSNVKAEEVQRPTTSPMTYFADIPFWIDYHQGVIKRINPTNANDTRTIYKGREKNISSISSIDCNSIDHGQSTNPCGNENGGCQHLCVLSRSNESKYRCFCKVGYELADDSKSCILPTKFVAFTQDAHLRGVNWREDMKRFVDVLDPSKRNPFSIATRLDMDIQEGVIFYSTRGGPKFPISHLEADLNDGKKKNLEPDILASSVTHIAYDWACKNLYYFTEYYYDANTLSVLNTKNATYSKIIAIGRWLMHGLAIHPNRGYVYFYELRSGSVTNLTRIHTDGSNSTLLLVETHQITCIAIDYNEDKLYWNEFRRLPEKSVHTICYSNLDGKEIKEIEVHLFLPTNMAIQGDWIYISNDRGRSLDRVGKKGGRPEKLLEASWIITGLRIYDSSIQTTRSDHPCAGSKNSCDKFCFAVPKAENGQSLERVCGCPYGEKLADNGRSCVDNSKEEPPLIRCKGFPPCSKPLGNRFLEYENKS